MDELNQLESLRETVDALNQALDAAEAEFAQGHYHQAYAQLSLDIGLLKAKLVEQRDEADARFAENERRMIHEDARR